MRREKKRPAAFLFAVILIGGAALHAYWALGGTRFLSTAAGLEAGTEFQMTPLIIAVTWLFVAGMLLAVVLALGRVGLIGRRIPQKIYAIGLWGVTICAAGGALMNFLTPRAWDRFLFGPIFLLLFVLSLILALPQEEEGRRRRASGRRSSAER